MVRKGIYLVLTVCILALAGLVFMHIRHKIAESTPTTPIETTTPAATPGTLPAQALLSDGYYIGQTFNNCGPAALSMDLSFYGVNVSQEVLADALRPDHNEQGLNDDKSTFPEQIAAQAEVYGLIAYYRPAGNIELLKQLVAAGFPVMVRTLFMPTDQVAHYRVIIGYDDATGQITDEDGYQGPHVTYSYANFLSLWKYYNYEYIVLAPPEKQAQVEAILGSAVDATTSWQNAQSIAQTDLQTNPNDTLAEFNLSVADYYLGEYTQAVQAFEDVQLSSVLPAHALWYQIEPIESYYELGDYTQVFSLSQAVFDQGNAAFPELYVLRGEAYEKEGDTTDAKTSFETALKYNQNLQSAKDALAALGD